MDNEEHDFDLTKKLKGKVIKSIVFDSRGAWEGCTGEIHFTDGTVVYISDTVLVKKEKEDVVL